jgi:hypothetical protein
MEARSMDKKKVIKFMINVLPIVLVPLIVERKRLLIAADVFEATLLVASVTFCTSGCCLIRLRSTIKKKVIKFMINVLPIVLVPLIVERKRIKQHPDVQKRMLFDTFTFNN